MMSWSRTLFARLIFPKETEYIYILAVKTFIFAVTNAKINTSPSIQKKKTKESWPSAPGFDFTPEGWCLSKASQYPMAFDYGKARCLWLGENQAFNVRIDRQPVFGLLYNGSSPETLDRDMVNCSSADRIQKNRATNEIAAFVRTGGSQFLIIPTSWPCFASSLFR